MQMWTKRRMELSTAQARRQRGFTLIEIMVVMAMLSATQRAVVWFAAAPTLVPLVAAALVLFEVLSPVWLPALVPLFGAGLWVGFAPVRRAAAVIRERTRAAWAGSVTALVLVLALFPWSGTVVCTVLTALGVAGTIALLWRESRIP